MTQRAAILGFGITGESVLAHLLRTGVDPVVIDTRPVRETAFEQVEFLWDTQHWPDLQVDYAVVSPGLSMDACLVRSALAAGVPLVSDIDLFFEAVTAPVIGITGTNGKSTVTSLAGHLLKHAGVSCGVGGNLGRAALDLIDPAHTCYVLELSSFQLERSREHAYHSATILNISEDHLDKHGTVESYVRAKQRIYTNSGRCIYNRADARTRPGQGLEAVSFGPDEPPRTHDWGIVTHNGGDHLHRGELAVCAAGDLALSGTHNLLNALAACAMVDGLVEVSQMAQGLRTFNGLAHRFETVARVGGVSYINDSKATNLGAAIAALAGLGRSNQVLLIAGGDAKGVDLSPLGNELVQRVRHVLTLGVDGPQLERIAAARNITCTACASLEDAVSTAAALARPGDVVLLSPACASLDMFDDYRQRGEIFAEAVNSAVQAPEGRH